jgi:uncharacterized protein YbaR (Trm112 family)
MLDAELIEILACPETKQPVRLAEPELVERVNRAIAAGTLKNREGEAVTEPIEAGLVREDGQYLYPVRDDIPVMLIGEGIELGRL